ncbi:MAG: hypothetical protein JNN20_04845 [Betaproteobacteria bacterium]|nr:hypothetical protein [Betaproteobacteria bacterium]
MNSPTPSTAPRSTFVSGLAWSFIGLGVLGGMIYLLQLVVMMFLYSSADYQLVARELESMPSVPSFLAWITRHMYLWIFMMLALCCFTTYVSWALLQRKGWARVLFVVMMWLGTLAHVAAAIAPFAMRGTLNAYLQSFPIEVRGDLQAMATMMTWVSVILAVVFGALFAWCAVRLSSPAVKAEFVAN